MSPPLVAFRETITSDQNLRYVAPANYDAKEGLSTANRQCNIKIRAVPLPGNITKFLQSRSAIMRRIFVEESLDLQENADVINFREQLFNEFREAGPLWENEIFNIWAFGPRRIGPNILLNHIPNYSSSSSSSSTPWKSIISKMETTYQPDLRNKLNRQPASSQTTSSITEESSDSKESDTASNSSVDSLISSEEKFKLLQGIYFKRNHHNSCHITYFGILGLTLVDF